MSAQQPLGPWAYDEPSNWHGLSARVVTEAYEPVCIISLSGWGKRKGRRIGHLIAAAPALLAALRGMLGAANKSHAPGEQGQRGRLQLLQAIQEARAAIQQATGEA